MSGRALGGIQVLLGASKMLQVGNHAAHAGGLINILLLCPQGQPCLHTTGQNRMGHCSSWMISFQSDCLLGEAYLVMDVRLL